MIKYRRTLCVPSLLVVLLGGCAAVDSLPPGEPPAMHDALVERMDLCLQQQEALQAQLQRQNSVLDEQIGRLEAVAAGVAKRAEKPRPAPIVPPAPRCSPAGVGGKLVVGELERVWFPNLGQALPARVDTGAETASLDARDIELFERDGERWVRFSISGPSPGELIELERAVVRRALIVQSNTAERERRPVIRLSVTIGDINQTAEFTLSDRSHLDFQVLIGRNILQDVMVVDVSRKNIAPYAAEATASGGIAP